MKKAFEFDLTNPEIMEYPYDFYNAIHRDNARAVEVKGVGYWIGRMDDIKAITKILKFSQIVIFLREGQFQLE